MYIEIAMSSDPDFGDSKAIAIWGWRWGGLVWFNVCVCVRIDGKYCAPGAVFGVHLLLGGVVDEFIAL